VRVGHYRTLQGCYGTNEKPWRSGNVRFGLLARKAENGDGTGAQHT
jgi:hypothetical protein